MLCSGEMRSPTRLAPIASATAFTTSPTKRARFSGKPPLIDSYIDRAAGPRRTQARQRLADLSEREQEVLRLLGRGEPNAAIAARLFVSEATVKTYVSRLLGKLELASRRQAAILAHEAGLLDG
jgi:DNA-binding NarL/FixJ family response regulator